MLGHRLLKPFVAFGLLGSPTVAELAHSLFEFSVPRRILLQRGFGLLGPTPRALSWACSSDSSLLRSSDCCSVSALADAAAPTVASDSGPRLRLTILGFAPGL
jgi:hypothetical protein